MNIRQHELAINPNGEMGNPIDHRAERYEVKIAQRRRANEEDIRIGNIDSRSVILT